MVIVRDEAQNLGRLLAHHRPLYDEAVVVDTGSRDGSASVAAAAGARVLAFAWNDDFAAARNRGLTAATGHMALVLDCDEHLAAADFGRVRALLDGPPAGWVFRQRNYCTGAGDPRWQPLGADEPNAPPGATGFVGVPTCRLFPVRCDVRYEGAVHEVPDRTLTRAGLALRAAGIDIHHRGHLLPEVDLERKNRLYGRLLRKKLEDRPEDPKTRHELAVQLVAEGRPALARRLLARTVREQPENPETLPSRLLLGSLLAAAGDADGALAQVHDAARRWPEQREVWTGAVATCLRAGRIEAAAQFRRGGLQLFPTDGALLAAACQVSRDPCRQI